MKRIFLFCAIGAILLSVSLVTPSCGSGRAQGPDTLKINTTESGAGIIGFNGPTPVEISVFQGVITGIEVLPNREGPRYLQMVRESGLLEKLIGKTMEEAKQERFLEFDETRTTSIIISCLFDIKARAKAQGSPPQFSSPSVIKIIFFFDMVSRPEKSLLTA